MPPEFMRCTRTKGATVRTVKLNGGGTRVICKLPGSKRWLRGEKRSPKKRKK